MLNGFAVLLFLVVTALSLRGHAQASSQPPSPPRD
jgi:hypothetical protein